MKKTGRRIWNPWKALLSVKRLFQYFNTCVEFEQFLDCPVFSIGVEHDGVVVAVIVGGGTDLEYLSWTI